MAILEIIVAAPRRNDEDDNVYVGSSVALL
jgi:hypothetical protein